MKAISIQQPWASLIVEGIKDVENRNWFTYYRGRIYIHTGKRFDIQGADLVSRLHPEYESLIEESKKVRGGIIGHVNLINCVSSHDSSWFHGKYGFVLASPQKIPFYPLKGRLSVFDFEFNVNKKNQRRERQLSLF
ncbi:ASCH domain-containing protein [Desulfobacula phenolica]|uniref:ASCH domain-containing protein n=1 Tax=Desulfobacula phenolica TaxID=90732 RepID=A0A1H2HJJ8_9BACT|nr:ASCH domain-containing protein [Desulfobacula phenolica]SDU31738.1 ASCH domain-containing protein [Desulfobacula phenolica]